LTDQQRPIIPISVLYDFSGVWGRCEFIIFGATPAFSFPMRLRRRLLCERRQFYRHRRPINQLII
jgi:hypothetical protein